MADPLFEDLPALLCFARVVELTSFTRAAAALGVAKSLVSRRVGRLEARLGERLLLRTTRKLSVTEAGLAVYAQASRMLESAGSATRDPDRGDRGLIRLNAPLAFAQQHLGPPLAAFVARSPGVRVELNLDDRLVDLVEQRVDLAVRITALRDSGLSARRLATTRLHVCAAPTYLARQGTPAHPADLVHHECLRYGVLRAEHEWRLYGERGRLEVPIASRFETSSGAMLRAAALAGMGLAMLPRFMVHEDLASGRLVTVLDAHAPRPLGIYLVQAERRGQPARLRALVEALVRAFRAPPWGA